MKGLRHQIVTGGAYLIGRQTLGMALSLAGTIAITRLIGPTNYGLYAGAFAINWFLITLGRLGLDVYLVRREDTPEAEIYNQAATLLAVSGVALMIIGGVTAPLLIGGLVDPRFVKPLIAMLPTIPLCLLAIPATAHLDRQLNFRAVAVTELGGQISQYAVACSLALLGGGVWAPIAGYWAWQIYILVRTHVVSDYRPRFAWSRPVMREMLRYSLSYSASMWIWQLRPLVNPLVVGRILGPEAVAFVSLAMRFVDVLTFVKSIIWRLSIAALGKIQRELDRLRRGLEEGMAVQVVAVGTALAVFAQVASWVVPIVFGSKWGPALGLYPFIALGCLVNAPFSQQSSVLNILKQNRSVAVHNAIHITIFAATCAALVPSFGLRGYAVAEIVALSSYVLLHRRIAAIFSFSYTQSAPWLIGFIPPLFAVFVSLPWGILLWLPLLMVALWPAQRRQINTYVYEMKMRFARTDGGRETTVDRSGALVAHEGVPQVLVSHVDNHVIANTNSDGVPDRFATIHRPKAHSHDLDTPVENGDRIQTPLALAPLPERPLVSVLIANYNYAHFIGQAIESVLSQTYSHVEVVVCDDGSTDDSVNVISRYAARDARVRWVHRPNGGMAAAWNTAYKMSSGDIVCTLDADDTFLPRKVELVVQRFCDHPQSGLVIHSLMVVDERGDEVQTIPILPKIEEGWIADAVTRRGGRWRSVQTSGLSFRRDVCRYVFPIVESTFRRGPDGFVGTLLPLLTEVSVVDEVLARYRVHSLNDLGSFGFDARAGRSVVDMVVASTNGVNARLAELGLESQRIDVNLNTGHSEYAFMLGLAEGRPQGVLIGEYRSLVAALLACDLYGLPSKLLKIIIYGVAVSLPDRLRRSWISWVLGCSRLKQRAIRFNRALTMRRGHA